MRVRAGILVTLVALSLAIWQIRTTSQAPSFDLLIRNGRVVDGTGNPWFVSDVGIKGDTIAAVDAGLDTAGAHVIDATGLVVAPGFIDVHSHAEARGDYQDAIGNPATENNIRQGVTTIFASPDGGGSVHVAEYLSKVTAARPAVNVGTFIGHGSVRSEVIGQADRAATGDEMQRMRSLVRTGMDEGAFGLSTGLFYARSRACSVCTSARKRSFRSRMRSGRCRPSPPAAWACRTAASCRPG